MEFLIERGLIYFSTEVSGRSVRVHKKGKDDSYYLNISLYVIRK